MNSVIAWLLPVVGGASLFFGSLVVYMLLHPDTAEKWASLLYRGISTVTRKWRGRYIAADIGGRIGTFSRRADSETDGAVPYGLRVEWVKEETREAFLRDGEIVVRMKYKGGENEQDRNFVTATMLYLSKGLVPHGRHYVDEELMRSADLTFARNIFAEQRRGALDCFFEEVLNPEMRENPNIQQYCNALDSIDRIGFFTRILLREFLELGRKMYPGLPRREIKEEAKNFFTFVEDIANRERGEFGELDFTGKKIRVGVVLVARPELLAERGTDRHKLRIELDLGKKMDAIYVCGFAGNVRHTTALVKHFYGSPQVEDIDENPYKIESRTGRMIDAVCYVIKPFKA